MRHDEILGLLDYLLAIHEPRTFAWAMAWELAWWAVAILLALLLWRLAPRWPLRAEASLKCLAQHRALCAAGLTLAPIVLRLAMLPWVPVPLPVIHDECSNLVGADTFAAGRLTNPTHPMWVHFETFHVNMQPTYQSMYPPAQAMVLGLGQRLTGEPWAGVLLSVAAMCGAFYWMLLGWLPAEWALAAGVACVLRFGLYSYWTNSFFGGAVAALGGALVVGAAGRLRGRLSVGQALLFVAGLLILGNSRPMEGLALSLPMTVAALWWMWRSEASAALKGRVLAAAVALAACGAAGMLYYNLCGTGHALEMPYALNQRLYHISRPLLFQKAAPIPQYHHFSMRVFYVFHEYPDLLRARSLDGVMEILAVKYYCLYTFLLWPLGLLFPFALWWAWRGGQARALALGTLAVFSILSAQLWPAHGHYAAPALGALWVVQWSALRELHGWRGRAWAPWLGRVAVCGLMLWNLVPLAERLWNPFAFDSMLRDGHCARIPLEIERARIAAQLERTPGRHLVIVHYGLHDVPSQEWVYNRASIDTAKVVWARDMDDVRNRELLDYFADRKVWWVDHGWPLLMTYQAAMARQKMAEAAAGR